jgi:hypothetical protein
VGIQAVLELAKGVKNETLSDLTTFSEIFHTRCDERNGFYESSQILPIFFLSGLMGRMKDFSQLFPEPFRSAYHLSIDSTLNIQFR